MLCILVYYNISISSTILCPVGAVIRIITVSAVLWKVAQNGVFSRVCSIHRAEQTRTWGRPYGVRKCRKEIHHWRRKSPRDKRWYSHHKWCEEWASRDGKKGPFARRKAGRYPARRGEWFWRMLVLLTWIFVSATGEKLLQGDRKAS